MKYGNTSRSLSLFFHGILALGGAVLAAYFGFFVLPTTFVDSTAFILTYVPLNLKLEMAIFGLTGAVISGYGFFQALRSLSHPSDDTPVLKSFQAFIVLGYVAALFFFLNGVVYFDLIANTASSGTSPAFVIVVAIILAVGCLIAANVPMVRLFDNKGQDDMYRGIALGFSVNFFSATLFSLIALIGLLANQNSTNFNNVTMLILYVGFSLVAGLLALFCGLLLKKKGQLSGLLGSLAVLVVGAAYCVFGGLELGWGGSTSFHFNSWSTTMTVGGDVNSYGLACIVFGAAVALAAVICMLVLFKPWESEKSE